MRRRIGLVTGASRGIGRAIATSLGAHGWHVIVNYRRNRVEAERTLAEIHGAGGDGTLLQADVAETKDRERLVSAVIDAHGRIDLLVNNAGIGPRVRTDMLHVGLDSFHEVLATNLEGAFFLTQLVARRMIELFGENDMGELRIINIGSISALASSTSRAEYCISKAALGMATMLWADRLAEYGICVYEVRPGIIDTDMTSAVRERYDDLIDNQGIVPLDRWGKPSDVAAIVTSIAEGALPFSTGEILYVDGGLHIRRL
jgi:3-oxoacyl-[acyl-carrier protein] reductase